MRQTVLRIAHRRGVCQGGTEDGARLQQRRSTATARTCADACVGGANDRLTCGDDGDCPGGRCGALFDAAAFAALAADGGAIVLPRAAPAGVEGVCQVADNAACTSDAQCTAAGDACVLYALEAQNPVSLDSLTTKTERPLRAHRRRERSTASIATATATSPTSSSRCAIGTTGAVLPLGAPVGLRARRHAAPDLRHPRHAREPRASSSPNQQGFVLPAIAFEGEAAAFLESEAGENACDENGDGDRADAILRVFTLVSGEVERRRRAAARRSIPSPLVNGQPLAVSDGKVFFRTVGGRVGRAASRALVSIDAGLPADGGRSDASRSRRRHLARRQRRRVRQRRARSAAGRTTTTARPTSSCATAAPARPSS